MNYQYGFALLESLISLVLLSIIIISFSSLQSQLLAQHKASFYATYAMTQVNDVTDELRTSQHDLTTERIEQWNIENKTNLPNGLGTISGAYPIYDIKVIWGRTVVSCEHEKTGLSGCVHYRLKLQSE